MVSSSQRGNASTGQDVKLKIVQQEGYDAHDFNLYDDRSGQLWRKPYVDGAVRELTAGDSRSQEQIRQAVEQLMISAGNTNPDVRHTSRKAHRSAGSVTVSVEFDEEDDMLTDMTRSFPRAAQHMPSRAGPRRPRHFAPDTCLSGSGSPGPGCSPAMAPAQESRGSLTGRRSI